MTTSNRQRNRLQRMKRQAGFTIIEVIVAIAVIFLGLRYWVYPTIRNGMENGQATQIAADFNTILQAAYSTEFGTNSDYTDIEWSDLPDHLPIAFTQRAPNDQDFDIDTNTTSNTKVDVSLNIPDNRLRAKVKSKFDASQYSETGTTLTVTGP